MRFLLVVPGAPTNENELHELCVRHHRWGQSRPTFAAERTQNHSASSAQWNTFEEVVDTEDEDNDGSDTVDLGDLQEYARDELEVLATCIDNGENDAPIPGVDEGRHISVKRRNHLSQWSTSQRDTCLAVEGNSRIPAHEERVHFTYFGRNVIELQVEVREFEPNQDAGTRQILSVQVDVSDVRLLRPSTRLVLAMNSMDVEERELAVSSTLEARYTVAGRA